MPHSDTMSPIQSPKGRSSTGSLSRGNSTGAAIRRGEIKISEPIPIPREGMDGFGPQAGVSSPDFQSATSLRNPKVQSERASAGRTETPQPPKRSSPPITTHKSVAMESQNPNNASYHARAWSNSHPNPHDSMSSAPSKSSVKKKRKEGGLRSVIRKIFGNRRGEEQRRSNPLEHRSVSLIASPWRDLRNLLYMLKFLFMQLRLDCTELDGNFAIQISLRCYFSH
jgi:hypothetical protein